MSNTMLKFAAAMHVATALHLKRANRDTYDDLRKAVKDCDVNRFRRAVERRLQEPEEGVAGERFGFMNFFSFRAAPDFWQKQEFAKEGMKQMLRLPNTNFYEELTNRHSSRYKNGRIDYAPSFWCPTYGGTIDDDLLKRFWKHFEATNTRKEFLLLRDQQGWTAVAHLCFEGKVRDGLKPLLEYSKKEGMLDEVLRPHGMSALDEGLETVLEIAAHRGHLELVNFLLSYGKKHYTQRDLESTLERIKRNPWGKIIDQVLKRNTEANINKCLTDLAQN